MQEVWWRGEPELRPDSGYVLLQCTPGMDALEAQYHGRVLLFVAVGDRIAELTAKVRLDVLENKTFIFPSQVCIKEATPQHDLWPTLKEEAMCTHMLESPMC